MPRNTLAQFRQRMPEAALGVCQTDIPAAAAMANNAQEVLINAGGENGWWGAWQEVVFNVDPRHPYITVPRGIQRLINMTFCRTGMAIHNQFYEFLEAGVGLQDFRRWRDFPNCRDGCGNVGAYDRGTRVTMRDIEENQFLMALPTNPLDIGKRILVGPVQDANGNFIYTMDGNNQVNGFYLTLTATGATTNFTLAERGILGIQKDVTQGDVLLYQVDATTGAQVLLSRYAPTEINPVYRRYYLNDLPCGCPPRVPVNPCISPLPVVCQSVRVSTMAKLDYIPVVYDTDFLTIGNLQALFAECKSQRFGNMDTPQAASLKNEFHKDAIRYLNEELNAFLGKMEPAVNFAPFGRARTNRVLAAVANG